MASGKERNLSSKKNHKATKLKVVQDLKLSKQASAIRLDSCSPRTFLKTNTYLKGLRVSCRFYCLWVTYFVKICKLRMLFLQKKKLVQANISTHELIHNPMRNSHQSHTGQPVRSSSHLFGFWFTLVFRFFFQGGKIVVDICGHAHSIPRNFFHTPLGEGIHVLTQW